MSPTTEHAFKPQEGRAHFCDVCNLHQGAAVHHPLEKKKDIVWPTTQHRITREAMFMEVVETVRRRSTCLRGQVGCVIARDHRIIATGYNGSPPYAPHCFDVGCLMLDGDEDAGCQRTIHAELNAVAWAARAGIGAEGGTMYSTHSPCLRCAQAIASAGIKRFVYTREYRLGRLDVLEESRIEVVKFGVAGQD